MPTENTQGRQWGREDHVRWVTGFEAASARGASQRSFAQERGIPRTSLQYQSQRKAGLDAAPALVEFFESPAGLAFLHRLMTAVQFVLCCMCGVGLGPLAVFVELAGLEPFVANSHGSHHKRGAAIEEHVRAFGREQRTTLAQSMEPKAITLCQDETFHPEICLVAMEPVSNFIVLEKYADKRDADAWSDAVADALDGLPVHVVQSTSDEGKGLLSHVRNALEAHHSPDLFHIQQELNRATSTALASQVRHAEQAAAHAAAAADARRAEAQAWGKTKHGPGRPPAFQARIDAADDQKRAADQLLETARARKERAARAIREIGTTYHPVDLTTGALQTAAQATDALEGHFAAIRAVADEAALPERCLLGIRKAHRLLPALADTLAFFHGHVQRRLDELALSSTERQTVERQHLPAAYLDRVARKAAKAETRTSLRDLAHRLRSDSSGEVEPTSAKRFAEIDAVVQNCVDLFQRSSSCVEGRNGQLSLRHHSLHEISPKRLEALTTIHNYFIRRPDGSTAAQRFFGTPHAALFDYILARVAMPARPAARRSRTPSDPLLN